MSTAAVSSRKRPALAPELQAICALPVSTLSVRKIRLCNETDQGDIQIYPSCPVCEQYLVPLNNLELSSSYLVCPDSILKLYQNGKESEKPSGRLHSFAHFRTMISAGLIQLPVSFKPKNKLYEFYSYEYCSRGQHSRDKCELIRRMSTSDRWKRFNESPQGVKFLEECETLGKLYDEYQKAALIYKNASDSEENLNALNNARRDYMIKDDQLQAYVNKFQQTDYEAFRTANASSWARENTDETKRRKMAKPKMTTSGDMHQIMIIQRTNCSGYVHVVRAAKSPLFGRICHTCATFNCATLKPLGDLPQNNALIVGACIPNNTKMLPNDALSKRSLTDNILDIAACREYGVLDSVNDLELTLSSLVETDRQCRLMSGGHFNEDDEPGPAEEFEML